ncbi:hypothetical protein LCGC14_1416290 [marine sediment metagenome]|uniref:TRAFD1/XAF1 zinc finger domain-containing protein n=1 Tax=marine sediment metagenome TaxID=412755 RepID=A0A0F9MUF9_9ZZZZ
MDFCENCRNNVPQESWNLHEATCARHRYYCESCETVLSKNERDKHNQEYHAMILCTCGEEIEARKLAEHKMEYCSQRIVPCIYCEYPLAFSTLYEHENACGSRTESCDLCGKRVMLRHQNTHVCGENDEPVTEDELVICPFCLSPAQNYMLLQEHIFSNHPEIAI